MPNLAFREKSIKDTELEKIYLYRLQPPTELGTEYVLVKTSRIHNPRFPEKDFYNIMYAKSSPEGDAKSDFKLYKYIESEKSGLSKEELRNRYKGLDIEDLSSYYEEYSNLYDQNPTEFKKILKHLREKEVNPDERDELNSVISIMTDISSGKKQPERLENPDVNMAISNLFRAIGDGYSISKDKPKRKDIFGLGEWSKLSKHAKRIMKENSKILFMISEIGKLDIDPEGETSSPKPKETPAQKLKRFSGLDLGEPEQQTEPAPSTPVASKRFRNLDIEEPSDKGTVSPGLSAKPEEEALDHITAKKKEEIFQVLYAGDRDGNPTAYKDCYFCILAFGGDYGLVMNHLGGGQHYYYLLIVDGKVKEYTQYQGIDGDPSDRPAFLLDKNVGKKAFEYIKNKNLPIARDIISNMERWGGNVPTNRYQPNQNAPFYETIENKSDPKKPIRKPITLTGTDNIITKLSLPYKKGGLGAGSFAEQKRSSDILDRKKDISYYADRIISMRNVIKDHERIMRGKDEFVVDINTKAIKRIEDQISKVFDEAESSKSRFSKTEIENYIKNPTTPKSEYIWHDRGLRLIQNEFTDEKKNRSWLDLKDRPAKSSETPNVEISLDDDIL